MNKQLITEFLNGEMTIEKMCREGVPRGGFMWQAARITCCAGDTVSYNFESKWESDVEIVSIPLPLSIEVGDRIYVDKNGNMTPNPPNSKSEPIGVVTKKRMDAKVGGHSEIEIGISSGGSYGCNPDDFILYRDDTYTKKLKAAEKLIRKLLKENKQMYKDQLVKEVTAEGFWPGIVHHAIDRLSSKNKE